MTAADRIAYLRRCYPEHAAKTRCPWCDVRDGMEHRDHCTAANVRALFAEYDAARRILDPLGATTPEKCSLADLAEALWDTAMARDRGRP